MMLSGRSNLEPSLAAQAVLLDIEHRKLISKKDYTGALDILKRAINIFPENGDPKVKAEIASNFVHLLEQKGEKNAVNNHLKTSYYPLIAQHATSSEHKEVRAQALVHLFKECKGDPKKVMDLAGKMAEMMVKTHRGDEQSIKIIKDTLKEDPELRKAFLTGVARGKGEAGVKEMRKATQSSALGAWLNSQASWGERLSELFSSKPTESHPKVEKEETPRMRSPGR